MSENSQASSDEQNKTKRGPRRRQVHNEVERRRKDKINSWIVIISELLPNKELHKQSKISILEQTVSYIKQLVAEKTKLLLNQFSDVQAQEFKSLKRSVKLLEEKNLLYSMLLQEANISLTSLPKKTSKYSNKFTEEIGEKLLGKLASTEQVDDPDDPILSVQSAAEPVLNNIHTSVQSCVKVSQHTSNFAQGIPVTNNVPIVTVDISEKQCSQAFVAVSASPKVPTPMVNIAPCRVATTTMLSAGGVTSALPSLPVMSSTLGSSMVGIHNKSMQLIILPNGTGILQPSIIPSNISLVAPALEPPSFSILMTPQPPTVIAVSANSKVITSNSILSNSEVSANVVITSEVPTETNQDVSSDDAQACNVSTEGSSSTSSISGDDVPSVPVFKPEDDQEDKIRNIKKMVPKNGELPNVPSSVQDKNNKKKEKNIKGKQIINRPQSLQVLAANKIILLASKFQMPCKGSTFSHPMNDASIPPSFSVTAADNVNSATKDRLAQNQSLTKAASIVPLTNETFENVNCDNVMSPLTEKLANNSAIARQTSSAISSEDINETMSSTLKNSCTNVIQVSTAAHLDSSVLSVQNRPIVNQTSHPAASLESKDISSITNDSVSKNCKTSTAVTLEFESSTVLEGSQSLENVSSTTATKSLDIISKCINSDIGFSRSNYIPVKGPAPTPNKIQNIISIGSVPVSSGNSKRESNVELFINAIPNSKDFPSPAKTSTSLTEQIVISASQSLMWNSPPVSSLSVNNLTTPSSGSSIIADDVKESCFFNSSAVQQQVAPRSSVLPNFQYNKIQKNKSLAEPTANKLKPSKRKIMPEPSTETIPINSFPDYAFDILNPVNDLVSQNKCIENHIPQQKVNSINSTSDILAKAAESIFGNDAFNTMEVVSAQTLAQQIETTDSFIRSTVQFTNTGIEAHSSSLVTNTLERAFNDHTSTGISFGAHYINGMRNSKYDQSSRVRKIDDNGGEPQPKKAKEQHTMNNLPKDNCLPHDSLLATVPTNRLTAEKSDIYQVITNSNPNSLPSNGLSQVLTFVSTKQPQFCTTNEVLPPVCVPSIFQSQNKESQKGSSSTGNQPSITSKMQSNFQSTTASNFPVISHPINSLFSNTCNANVIGLNKNSFVTQGEKQNNGKKGTEQPKLTCSSGGDLNKKGLSDNSVNQENIATKLFPSNVVNVLNNSNPMQILPTDNRSFFGIQHVNNNNTMQTLGSQTTSYSSHADTLVAITPSKFSTTNISSSSETIPPTLPPLLSRDPNSRVLTAFDANLPIISSSSIDVSDKNCQLATSNNSLSHSLCSLLKEPSSNSVFPSVASVTNSINSEILPSLNTVVKSKYSALSLISNVACSETSYVKSNGSLIFSVAPSNSHESSSVVSNCRSQKSSLSYSAERLIQSQYTSQEKDRTKTSMVNYNNTKKVNCVSNVSDLYKSNSFVPASSEMSVTLPLPPVTSFPSFPSSFPMCDGRTPTSICNSSLHPYQDATTTTTTKDNVFPQNSIISNIPNSSSLTQTCSSFTKSTHNVPFNVENHGNMYSSCNFLQHTKPNLDIMKVSDSSTCFQSLFANSGYPQQVQKQNYCPFIEQSAVENGEKSFSMMPPPIPSFHGEKEVTHDHRPPLMSNISPPNSNYLGNIFYDTASCSHESASGNKPSIVRTTQDAYMPLRNKQTGQTINQHKPLASGKGKTKKSKHSSPVESNLYKTTFNSNTMNFNVFTVPDLSNSKSSMSHSSNNYPKSTAQATLPILRDSSSQQCKIGESVLGSVMHPAFNHGLHQQNDSFLNLNFQPPTWNSDGALTVPSPLTLPSPCTSTSKVTRSFSAGVHPVPNFNLSNILPDMGASSSDDLNSSPIKFQASMPQGSHQECHVSSVPSNSVPHQTTLYAPHPSVVPPNALLNTSLSRNQSAPANIPPIPHSTPFTPTQAPPFRNVIHSLNFSRN